MYFLLIIIHHWGTGYRLFLFDTQPFDTKMWIYRLLMTSLPDSFNIVLGLGCSSKFNSICHIMKQIVSISLSTQRRSVHLFIQPQCHNDLFCKYILKHARHWLIQPIISHCNGVRTVIMKITFRLFYVPVKKMKLKPLKFSSK